MILSKSEDKILMCIRHRGEVPVDQVNADTRSRLRAGHYVKQEDNRSSKSRAIVLVLDELGVDRCNEIIAYRRKTFWTVSAWLLPFIVSVISLWIAIRADNKADGAQRAVSVVINHYGDNQRDDAPSQSDEVHPIKSPVIVEPHSVPESSEPESDTGE